MATPTTTDATASKLDSLIQGIEGILVPITENAIIAACPDLGLPVVKQITEDIEQGLANEATKIGELYTSFAVDDVQVDSENAGVSKELQAVIAAEKGGDPNAIQAAIQAYQRAVSALNADDGSVSP